MASTLLLALLFAVALGAAVPAAFADHQTVVVSQAAGSSTPGCEKTNTCFEPYKVTIDVGSEVRWDNNDSVLHTVASGNAFDSGLIPIGASFSHTFDVGGTYEYICTVHPWMRGVVLVSGASTTTDAGSARNQQGGVQATVTAAERGLGVFVDRWTFTVNATNTGSGPMDVAMSLGTNASSHPAACAPEGDPVTIAAGATATLSGCFFAAKSEHPTMLQFTSVGINRDRVLPFTPDACDDLFGAAICLPQQSIDNLTVESAAQCPATAGPSTVSASYYRPAGMLVLAFDVPVTLADGWQDRVGISVGRGSGSAELTGLGSDTGIATSQPASLVWLSLGDGDRGTLGQEDRLRITIDTGAVLDADGGANDRMTATVSVIGSE